MFRVDKVLHCTMKNQGGNQCGMAFFQKQYAKSFEKFKRIMIIIINSD
jgi:hypothetical protein